MTNPSITLTSYNMGDNATEADYDSFIAYVCDGIDALCGFEVEVDSSPFGRGPASDAFDGTDEQIETMRDAMRDLWDSWCAEPAKVAAL